MPVCIMKIFGKPACRRRSDKLTFLSTFAFRHFTGSYPISGAMCMVSHGAIGCFADEIGWAHASKPRHGLHAGRVERPLHFLNQLQATFSDDVIFLICDGAAWHKSWMLKVPDQITILHIPPYTPEMNPIEQIWHELRTSGFHNEVFSTLEKVVDCLCETINHLSNDTVKSIAQRDWIKSIFI